MNRLILGSLASIVLATGAQAATIYGVDENNILVTFNSTTPGVLTSQVQITGLTNSISALDFRPLTNTLYALGSNRVVYTVDLATGVATAVSAPLALNGPEFAFDFNPTVDRLRIVSNANNNYVFNPNDGSLTTATNVAYAAGDPNAGKNPDVTAAAYTTSTFGAPGASTQLYSIDTAQDVLTRQANSAGTLTTVGALGFNLGSRTSFDISRGDAFAFNGTSLFSVNLATGALTRIGNTDRALFGIAIAAVPEASSWAMMIAGVGMAGFALRRRRGKVTTTVRFA